MAAEATLEKITVNILLNNGTSPTGSVKTVNVKPGGSSQNIDTTKYNTDLAASRQAIINIGVALNAILAKSIYAVNEVMTNSIAG